MKKIQTFIILSLSIFLILNSCSIFKNTKSETTKPVTRTASNNNSNNNTSDEKSNDVPTEDIVVEENNIIEMPDEPIDEPIVDMNLDMNLDVISISRNSINNKIITENNNSVELSLNNADNSNEKTYPTGHLSYIVPDTMKIAEFYTISLLITKDTSLSQVSYMIEKLDNIAITDNKELNNKTTSTISVNKIRVSSIMSSRLIDIEDKFDIIEISTQKQNIDTYGQTQWIWKVSPKESGSKILKLIVSVKIKNELGISEKDIPVLKKNIFVETNYKWTIKNFFKSYWQWIISTLILPLLIYIWSRRKNKNKNKKK